LKGAPPCKRLPASATLARFFFVLFLLSFADRLSQDFPCEQGIDYIKLSPSQQAKRERERESK